METMLHYSEYRKLLVDASPSDNAATGDLLVAVGGAAPDARTVTLEQAGKANVLAACRQVQKKARPTP